MPDRERGRPNAVLDAHTWDGALFWMDRWMRNAGSGWINTRQLYDDIFGFHIDWILYGGWLAMLGIVVVLPLVGITPPTFMSLGVILGAVVAFVLWPIVLMLSYIVAIRRTRYELYRDAVVQIERFPIDDVKRYPLKDVDTVRSEQRMLQRWLFDSADLVLERKDGETMRLRFVRSPDAAQRDIEQLIDEQV